MLKHVAETALEKSQYAKEEMEFLISTGVYRSEFLTEPALAALLAGDLEMNDGRQPNAEHKTFAFDILNGAMGFLNACYLVSELSRAGCLERAMIVASEIENNAEIMPDQLLGLKEMASAVILHESNDGETGFLAFSFDQYPEHADVLRVVCTWNDEGKPHLIRTASKDRYLLYVEDIEKSISRFLRAQAVSRDEIRFLIPPQISPAFVRAVSQELDLPKAETIDVSTDGEDLATSSTPAAMQAILEGNLAEKGDLALIINVSAGGQVGCALYQF
jgi:3-oxoacyl-[acyl-carrier-protein] synthase III